MIAGRSFFSLYPLMLLLFLFTACKKGAPVTPAAAAADTVNMGTINSAFANASEISSLKSLIVTRSDTIIREAYFPDGGPNYPDNIYSVTKTVMSLLIGIAIDRGIIASADTSVKFYLNQIGYIVPENKSTVTIKHLLNMSSGIPWIELQGPSEYSTWTASSDQVQYMLNKTPEAKPGTYFNYNSGAIHLLSPVLTKASGINTLAFADSFLFKPLGITNRYWSKDRKGYYYGSSALSISPRDLLKIGLMMMHSGLYNGTQVVSSKYISIASSALISTHNQLPYGTGYGYGTWTGTDHEKPFYFGMGYGGQFLIVIPHLKVVIVATSDASAGDVSTNWIRTVDLIMKQIVPAFY